MNLKIYTFTLGLLTVNYSAQLKDTLAEKMLVYQLPNGGWGKQLEDKSVVNYNLPVDKNLQKKESVIFFLCSMITEVFHNIIPIQGFTESR